MQEGKSKSEDKVATYTIRDFSEGQEFSFIKTISEKDVNDFACLSGDLSPLHINSEFACSRGFGARVVHGALLISYLSRLVGVYFPGENGLLQTINIKFLSPAYIDDTVEIASVVEQISLSMNVIVLKVSIRNIKSKIILVKGKVQVGFTK